MSTNANSEILTTILANRHYGFASLITAKVGVQRGRGSNKKTYGDDQVLSVFVSGFRYGNLVQRSLDALNDITDADVMANINTKGAHGWVKGVETPVTLADVAQARTEMVASFQRTLDPSEPSTSTTAHVFEPLLLNDKPVRGAKVYRCVADDTDHKCKCRTCTGDEKAPLDGTIYISGLQVASKVLTPAPNGPKPFPNSKPKTVAKNFLKKGLPVKRYIQFRLEPGTDFMLKAGGTAATQVTDQGIILDEATFAIIKAA